MPSSVRSPLLVALGVLVALSLLLAGSIVVAIRGDVSSITAASSLRLASVTMSARQLSSSGAAAGATTVSGLITCLNNASPVGVWVDAESGTDGWAKIAVPIIAGGHSKVTYSFVLSKGGRFKVNVGCGGKASAWGLSLSSTWVSGNSNFLCNDINPVLAAISKRLFRVDLTQGVPYATCRKS